MCEYFFNRLLTLIRYNKKKYPGNRDTFFCNYSLLRVRIIVVYLFDNNYFSHIHFFIVYDLQIIDTSSQFTRADCFSKLADKIWNG
jgi:hypothetical protein